MGGKAKGSNYEREICTALSLWWSNGRHDDLIWRSAGSGARSTVRSRKQKRTHGHAGDLCPTCPEAQPLFDLIAIECKRGYNKATIADLLDKPPTAKEQTLEGWIKQAIDSRNQSGAAFWMIIHKRDRRNATIILPQSLAHRLELRGPYLSGRVIVGESKLQVTVANFSSLLKIDPKVIKKLAKEF